VRACAERGAYTLRLFSSLSVEQLGVEQAQLAAMTVTFTSLRVPSHFLSRVARLGFNAPTAPQRVALDALMPRSPSDVSATRVNHAVLRWPTGSGKTLAYALPLVARLDVANLGGGLQALVLCPTRELVLQTLHVLQKLAGQGKTNRKGHAIKVQALLGQRNQQLEAELWKSPPDIAIGTPHIVGSLLELGLLPLAEPRKRTLVLDEVGALCESYRWPEVRKVLGGTAAGAATERRWAAGSMWLVSADVPAGAATRCLQAAGVRAEPTMLEPSAEQNLRLPRTLRHVTLPPNVPLAATLAELVAWMSPNEADESVGGGGPMGPVREDARTTTAARVVSEAIDAMDEADYAAGEALDAPHSEQIEGAAASAAAAAAAAAALAQGAAKRAKKSKKSSARAIVFVESAHAAEQLRRAMRNRSVSAVTITGADATGTDSAVVGSRIRADGRGRRDEASDASRRARAHSLRLFAEGRVRVLIATDMLALGMDVRGASHVVNVSVPSSASIYLHRAGRVGRIGGLAGTVLSLPRNEDELTRLRGFAEELGFDLDEAAALTCVIKRPLRGGEIVTDASYVRMPPRSPEGES